MAGRVSKFLRDMLTQKSGAAFVGAPLIDGNNGEQKMEEKGKDVVPSAYRDKYKATGGGNGDFIATTLSKVGNDGIAALDTVKAENAIEKDRWSTFNPGMQRMNLANVLRGRYLKGETIKILGKEYNVKEQSEDFNGTVANDPKVMARLAGFLGLAETDRVVAALTKIFFPPAPKGKTAEERAAEKAEKEAAKAKAKEEREAEKARVKAEKEADKAAKAKAREDAKAKREADKAAAKEAKAAKAA